MYGRPRPSAGGPQGMVHPGAQQASQAGVGGGYRPVAKPSLPKPGAAPQGQALIPHPMPVATLVPPVPQQVPVPHPVPLPIVLRPPAPLVQTHPVASPMTIAALMALLAARGAKRGV